MKKNLSWIKTRFAPVAVFLALIALWLSGICANAATLYWDTSAGLGNGVGGSGNWGTNLLAPTFSTTPTGDATLTTASSGDDLYFQGTAGTVILTNNLPNSGSFNSINFNVTGYILEPDSKSRILTGPITIAAGLNLNLMDTTTSDRTLNLNSSINGGANSMLTLRGEQTSASNASRVNLDAAGVTISVPTTISSAAGTSVIGYVGTAAGTQITGNITNNSSATTMIGCTSGNDLTVNAVISGSAGLQFSAGVSGGAGTITLEQPNTYAGPTTFNAAKTGTVKLGVANALPTSTDFTWYTNGGTFDLNGFSQTIGSLQSTNASGVITNSGSGSGTDTLTIGGSTTPPNSFDQSIKDSGTRKIAITRSGTGSTILSGNNTFSGQITITGGELGLNGDAAFGAVPGSVTTNAIVIDGGRMTCETKGGNGQIYTLNANRGIQVGSTDGTSISVVSGGALTYNGVIADKPGSTGILVKQGGGPLILGGTNTYSGETFLNNGVLQLTNGGNILPMNTVVTIGQTNSGNLGTFDLNGYNQQIAGLDSGSGTNTEVNQNTVTDSSATMSTLTISGSGNYAYGDGSTTNSGIISGPVTLVMNGSGTQTLGDANSYTGNTIIWQGTLALGINGVISSSPLIVIAGGATFDVSAIMSGLTLGSSQTLQAGGTTSAGTIATGSGAGLTLGATSPLLFSAFNGTTAPLTITGSGTIGLASGNVVSVTNSSGSPFAANNYKLISKGSSGGVTGTAPTSVAVYGNGIVGGGTPSLVISNGELYLRVTMPASNPATNSISFSGTTATIGVVGVPSSKYALLTTTNLTNAISLWLPVQTNMTDITGKTNFIYLNATNHQQFYRTEQLP
jgi:fibronectin-binding autotransporter adhesin